MLFGHGRLPLLPRLQFGYRGRPWTRYFLPRLCSLEELCKRVLVAKLTLCRFKIITLMFAEPFRRSTSTLSSEYFTGCGVDFCLEWSFTKHGKPSYSVKCTLDGNKYMAVKAVATSVSIKGDDRLWRWAKLQHDNLLSVLAVAVDIPASRVYPSHHYAWQCNTTADAGHTHSGWTVQDDVSVDFRGLPLYFYSEKSYLLLLIVQELMHALTCSFHEASLVYLITVLPEDCLDRFISRLTTKFLCIQEIFLWKFLGQLCSAVQYIEMAGLACSSFDCSNVHLNQSNLLLNNMLTWRNKRLDLCNMPGSVQQVVFGSEPSFQQYLATLDGARNTTISIGFVLCQLVALSVRRELAEEERLVQELHCYYGVDLLLSPKMYGEEFLNSLSELYKMPQPSLEAMEKKAAEMMVLISREAEQAESMQI